MKPKKSVSWLRNSPARCGCGCRFRRRHLLPREQRDFDHDFADGDDDGRDPRIFSHGAQVADVVTDTATDAQIIHLKVFEDFASGGELADVEAALQWVIANAEAYNLAAVNLSIGYGDVNQPTRTQLSDELSAIKAAGIVTVVSSGNDGRERRRRHQRLGGQ